jgi:hypothetical protein
MFAQNARRNVISSMSHVIRRSVVGLETLILGYDTGRDKIAPIHRSLSYHRFIRGSMIQARNPVGNKTRDG